MNINGWTKHDTRTFQELLIKANRLNLNQADILVNAELENRNRILSIEEQMKELRE